MATMASCISSTCALQNRHAVADLSCPAKCKRRRERLLRTKRKLWERARWARLVDDIGEHDHLELLQKEAVPLRLAELLAPPQFEDTTAWYVEDSIATSVDREEKEDDGTSSEERVTNIEKLKEEANDEDTWKMPQCESQEAGGSKGHDLKVSLAMVRSSMEEMGQSQVQVAQRLTTEVLENTRINSTRLLRPCPLYRNEMRSS